MPHNSILQNLEAAIPMVSIAHVEFGVCVEAMVPMEHWILNYTKVGTCSDQGFTQLDKAAYNVDPFYLEGSGRLAAGEIFKVNVWQSPHVDPQWMDFENMADKLHWEEQTESSAEVLVVPKVMAPMVNPVVKVVHSAEWCNGNDSELAMKVCPQKVDGVPMILMI